MARAGQHILGQMRADQLHAERHLVDAMPAGSVIVGLPLKSNTAVNRRMLSRTLGSAPYSPIFASVGIGMGMVGISSRSIVLEQLLPDAPENFSRS